MVRQGSHNPLYQQNTPQIHWNPKIKNPLRIHWTSSATILSKSERNSPNRGFSATYGAVLHTKWSPMSSGLGLVLGMRRWIIKTGRVSGGQGLVEKNCHEAVTIYNLQILVGGFKHFLFFHNIWDNLPNWLIFFRGVETTNQAIVGKVWPWFEDCVQKMGFP
jgi:hypothetical protein